MNAVHIEYALYRILAYSNQPSANEFTATARHPAQTIGGRNMSPHQSDLVDRAIADNIALDGAALPILHAIQDRIGHVPTAAVPKIAHALNLSRAEVHGVISFYHHFRTEPRGRHLLQVCRAEACQSMGGERLAKQVTDQLGIEFHHTTPDGAVTLEAVYCLGNCACAPTMLLDGEPHGRLDAAAVDALLAEART